MKFTNKNVVRCSLATASFLCFSCINSVQPLEEPSEPLSPTISGNIPIAISAQILKAQVNTHTRATNNAFDENDAIGLYVLSQPQTISGIRHIDNMRFAYSEAGFMADEEVYYPKGDGKCDFISYYPYQEEGVIKDASNIQISVNANQSAAIDYSLSDFMVAKMQGISPSMKAVNLRYSHKLSQLNIILQLNIEEDIKELQDNASISISNLNTKATYNMDTELFSSFNNPQNIIPNGQWKADEENHQLTGKRAILIPQATTGCEVTLRTRNKVYSAALPEDLILESETSCELLLIFDSRVGIGKISSSISEWKQGSNSNATLEEEEENNNSISISGLNFEKTGIYNLVTSTNTVIGKVCKEYLLNDEIDAQAIVLYPADNDERGTVLQIVGENKSLHGGSVIWDKDNNSLTYTAGNQTQIEEIHADKDGNITFEKREDIQQVLAIENVLTDIRGSETIIYPVVKIGTQYWMRENLNTAKYNDATAITNNTNNLNKKTAGYYLPNSYRFYNTAVITTGKIAPKGWRIPDIAEWDKLRAYLRNNAATMKNGIWNSYEGIPQANNKTGFNGIPVGIYWKDGESSRYGYAQRYAIYWAIKDNQKTLYESSVALSNKLTEIAASSNPDYSAYSIRCIKE